MATSIQQNQVQILVTTPDNNKTYLKYAALNWMALCVSLFFWFQIFHVGTWEGPGWVSMSYWIWAVLFHVAILALLKAHFLPTPIPKIQSTKS